MKKPSKFDLFLIGIIFALALFATGFWWLIERQSTALPDCPQLAIGANGPISLSFHSAMDPSSVEKAVVFDPPLDGHFSWVKNVLYFYPENVLTQNTTYQMILKEGSRTTDGRTIAESKACLLQVRPPEVVYISIEPGGSRLFRTDLHGNSRVEIGYFGGMILSYDISPDGEWLVLAVKNKQAGSDIWLAGRNGEIKQLLDCQKNHCESPVWNPDSQHVVFSRLTLTTAAPNDARLWVINKNTKAARLFFRDENIFGQFPKFSADGRYLTYFDAKAGGIQLVNLERNESLLLKTNSKMTAWSPDSNGLVYFNEVQENENSYTNALLYKVKEQKSTLLMDEYKDQFEYGEPIFTPDGEWLTMTVRLARTQASPSKQLIMVKMDGSDVRAITDQQLYTNSGYHWSPDGGWLVYQRFQFGSSSAKPEVMLWNPKTNTSTLLVNAGGNPNWLP